MIITIISVGNKLSKWENDGINFYTKQLKTITKINFINIKSQQNPKRSKNEVIRIESKLIMEKIPKDCELNLSTNDSDHKVFNEKSIGRDNMNSASK